MARRRYTEEQIIAVLKEGEAGRQSRRPLPQIWDQRRHLLQLEGQVRRAHRQ